VDVPEGTGHPSPGRAPDASTADAPVPRSPGLMRAAWAGAAVAWLAVCIRSDAGGIAVALLVTVVLALVARFLYLRLFLRRGPSWRVWSPWLFVVAASLSVVALTGAGIADRDEGGEALDDSEIADWKTGCRSGGLKTYDELPETHPTRVSFTREEMTRVMARFCDTAAERGYASERAPTGAEQAELEDLMQDVLADMRADGELPPS